jgi:hypothetical protein
VKVSTSVREAVEELRSELGKGKAFQEARFFALKACKQARRITWLTRGEERRFVTNWNAVTAAARRLAERLQRADKFQVWMALHVIERDDGVNVSPQDLLKLLTALSDQRIGPRSRSSWFPYGPIALRFETAERVALPSKTLALAVVLTHIFRCCSDKPSISFNKHGLLKVRGGKPCYVVAAHLASVTFNRDKAVTPETLKVWLQRHRGRIRYRPEFWR